MCGQHVAPLATGRLDSPGAQPFRNRDLTAGRRVESGASAFFLISFVFSCAGELPRWFVGAPGRDQRHAQRCDDCDHAEHYQGELDHDGGDCAAGHR